MVNWILVKLGDVLKTVSRPVQVEADKTYRTLGVQWYAKGLFVREEKIGQEIRAKELFRVELDDFVYNRLFAWKGSFGIVGSETAGGFVSGEFPCFRVQTDLVEPKFVQFYLSQEYIWKEIERNSTGQTNISRLRLKEPDFLAMEIPLPPLEEQRRIVERIEALAGRVREAVELRERAIEETDILEQSYVSELTKRLLHEYPHETLVNLTTMIGDMNHEMPNAVEDGISFISPKDFKKQRTIDFAGSKKISQEDYERLSRKCCPQAGDILMARYGTIGAARFVDTNIKFLASYSIAVIRPDARMVDNHFLYWMVIAPYIQEQAQMGIRGSGMADLGVKTIRQFTIPVPPLKEQRRIVAHLDAVQAKVDELRRLQAETREELAAMLPSILDRAFRGELNH